MNPKFTYRGRITWPNQSQCPIRGMMRAVNIQDCIQLIASLHKKHPQDWDFITIYRGESTEILYYNDGTNKPHVKLSNPTSQEIKPVEMRPAPKVIGPAPGNAPVLPMPNCPVVQETDHTKLRTGFGGKYTVHKA